MVYNKKILLQSSYQEIAFWVCFFFGLVIWITGFLTSNKFFFGLGFVPILGAFSMYFLKNPKIAIVMISVIVLSFFISMWYIENQPIYLTVGATAIMAISTTWFSANNLNQQTRIAENTGRRQYIAEIARSIFSAMQIEILKVRASIEKGPFFVGIFPLETRIAQVSPISYLTGNVKIYGNPVPYPMSPGHFWVQNKSGPIRPATVLLQVSDTTLQEKYLPKIRDLCEEYEKKHQSLNDSLNLLISKIPIFWDDFKNYSDSLDNISLKQVFEAKNSMTPNESYYHLLFRCAISGEDPIVIGSQELAGGITFHSKKDDLLKYIKINRGKILEWLLSSSVKEDVRKVQESFKDLNTIIDDLNDEINNLFVEWKVLYGLTEDEMNLQDGFPTRL